MDAIPNQRGETLMGYTMATTKLLVNSFTHFFFISSHISYILVVSKEVAMNIKNDQEQTSFY